MCTNLIYLNLHKIYIRPFLKKKQLKLELLHAFTITFIYLIELCIDFRREMLMRYI